MTAPPCVTAAPTTTVYAATGGFDPATVGEIADPTGECGAELKVLVVGDSTGRGAANGLAALGNPLVKLWDRTVLGCSFGDEDCPSWRERWSAAVAEIDPDTAGYDAQIIEDADPTGPYEVRLISAAPHSFAAAVDLPEAAEPQLMASMASAPSLDPFKRSYDRA